MELEGYPQSVILLVVGIGVPLAAVRPYAAFLLSLLLLTAGDTDSFNHTRLAALGPYLNLGDACVLVALVGLFFDRVAGKKPIRMPQIVPLMLFVVVIGAAQSFWKLGPTYETQRALRWAIQFPLCYFLGANLVTSARRAKLLVGVLVCGAVLAALQQVFFMANVWRARSLSMETYESMRTISYWGGCMASAFLISSVVWRWPARCWKKASYVVVGLLFLGSIILSMTRSLWIATVLSIPCLLVVSKGRKVRGNVVRFGVVALIIFCALAWACERVMPGVDVTDIVTSRVGRLLDSGQKTVHIGTRARALAAEMGGWMEGTIIFGRGLWFFQTVRNSSDFKRHIAFNHLGYVTYLSQLGALGLLIYGLYLPLRVLGDGRWLWHCGRAPIVRYVGVLGSASIICLSLMFVMSSHFLILGYEAPAALYGAMSALVRCPSRTWRPAGYTVLECR